MKMVRYDTLTCQNSYQILYTVLFWHLCFCPFAWYTVFYPNNLWGNVSSQICLNYCICSSEHLVVYQHCKNDFFFFLSFLAFCLLLSSNLLGRGQLCCYGNHSQLLNLNDNIAGGSIQSRHHLGFQPNYEVRNIPYFSNFLHDTIPWEECCGKTGKLSSCKLYSDLRPTSDCVGYSSPGIGEYI